MNIQALQFVEKKTVLNILIPLLIGLGAFFYICNPSILNPKNIYWFTPWSLDPSTNYLGWAFYRNSPWDFPLGLNPNYGLELGSTIIFSDSIPLLAIPLKIFSQYLPYPFQFLGAWILVCFVLQAYSGWMLSKLIANNLYLSIFFTLIVTFSPIFLYRLNLHNALASHFLILTSLYLCFGKKNDHNFLAWATVLSFAISIQAYLFVMIGGLWVADLVIKFPNNLKRRRRILYCIKALSITIGISIFAWILGYFHFSGNTVQGGGYGEFKFNLLSLFDSNNWSYILPDIKTPRDFSEGFNYFGLGVILLLPFSIISVKNNIQFYLCTSKKYSPLIFILSIFFLFSITNNISIGEFSFTYPLPSFILAIANTFRSTGRFFWPIYYVLLLLIFYSIWKGYPKKIGTTLLLFSCLIQTIDLSAGYGVVRTSMSFINKPLLTDAMWDQVATKYQKIIIVPVGDDPARDQPQWREIALLASKKNLSTNASYLARAPSLKTISETNQRLIENLTRGEYQRDTAYVLNQNYQNATLPFPILNPGDILTRIDGINLLLPSWESAGLKNTKTNLNLSEPILFNTSSVREFLRGNIGNHQLDYGWSNPESWGTWSIGSYADLSLVIPNEDVKFLTLQLRGFVLPNNNPRELIIKIEGTTILTMLITSSDLKTIRLPIPPLKDKLNIQIRFETPNSSILNLASHSKDPRALGIGLISAIFSK
jgi:hypothetical protein